MTELDVTPTPADVPTLASVPRHRVTAVAALSLLVVAGLVLVAAFAWVVAAPPPLVPAQGDGNSGPLTIGRTLYVDAAVYVRDDAGNGPESTPLRLDAIAPRISENSAKATIALLVCTRNGGSLGVGAQESGLDASCTSVLPFTGQQEVDLGFMRTQILLAVTATAPGTVHVEGLDVTYSDGGRAVTQLTGLTVTLTTTR